ncbi:hypothetical protein [Celeribacter indicus]|uniref:Major facilitator superfamily transporter n=1 Tax=Celeribacter indicus TaxID=1208324 RepID=A0A0B5E0Y2_9RHOB|nr:hypothetical protein [Celeribacter indicus]AJE46122.1 major facilitator superfamily transporter [Celeribacter indicus]SDX37482.1 hypothetical protein SAMN05443573_12450 [Celeribacter indicus]
MSEEGEPNRDTAAGQRAGTAPQAPDAAAGSWLTMPATRACFYFATAAILAVAQGFGQSMVSANSQQLQGSFGTTEAETVWLTAAYMAPNASLTLALIKLRGQFGLRRFAEVAILVFLASGLLSYVADDFWSNIAVRFFAGCAAAPTASLAFLYILEPLAPQRKMNVGLSAALTLIFMGSSLTRLISPHLLEMGGWHGLTALDAALAATSCGLIYLFPLLSPAQPMKIEAGDVISFLFIAVGFGCLSVAALTGPVYWWMERGWMGVVLATGVATLAIAAVIELNREHPLLDIRWLMSPAILHFAGTLLLFRLVLSEQTAGAGGLFRALGLLNEQTQGLWFVVLAVTILGGVICAIFLKPGRVAEFHVVALLLLIGGSLLDARSTVLTGPGDMYLSQAMIALASALFLPPALLTGLMSALAKGPNYILTFIIVFLTTQKIGGLIGSAVFSTFVTVRQSVHTQHLHEALSVTDPLVTERISTYAGALSGTITDAGILNAEAAAQLATDLGRRAAVMAYDDAFLSVAAVSGVALVLLIGHTAFRQWQALTGQTAAADGPEDPQPNPGTGPAAAAPAQPA